MEPIPMSSPDEPPKSKRFAIKVDLLKFLRWWKRRKKRKIDKSLHEFYKDIDRE